MADSTEVLSAAYSVVVTAAKLENLQVALTVESWASRTAANLAETSDISMDSWSGSIVAASKAVRWAEH